MQELSKPIRKPMVTFYGVGIFALKGKIAETKNCLIFLLTCLPNMQSFIKIGIFGLSISSCKWNNRTRGGLVSEK